MKPKKLTHAKCPTCKGQGFTAGLLQPLICETCNGVGRVNGTTGEALEDYEAIPLLRKALNETYHKLQTSKQLNSQLVDTLAKNGLTTQDPYEGSGRYKGD